MAPFAADHGVKIALEPLNPTSVNVESAIWTVAQALDVIEATGRDEVGLCLDYWNVWQNADIEADIRRAGERIFTVQASDWRTPRSFADRIVPGDGVIRLGPLLRANLRRRLSRRLQGGDLLPGRGGFAVRRGSGGGDNQEPDRGGGRLE